jgi:hypothetical protein
MHCLRVWPQGCCVPVVGKCSSGRRDYELRLLLGLALARTFITVRCDGMAKPSLGFPWRTGQLAQNRHYTHCDCAGSPLEFSNPPIPISELRSNLFHYFLDFTLRYIQYYMYISIRNTPMPPALPRNPRFQQPGSTPQLLCPQDCARNPFCFIDLAGTPSTRLNRFIDLRQNASFFQE